MGLTHRSAVLALDAVEVADVSNWREIVSNPNLDAIDICLPTDLHAAVTMEALACGKHVFCEKPMALTYADCRAMIAAAHQSNRVLMIGHVLRFWPEYISLKCFVEERHNSSIHAVFTRRSSVPGWGAWLADPNRSGGAILDLLIHDVDQSLQLFGKPKFVTAHSDGPVDTLQAFLEYEHGHTVRIQGGWYPEPMPFHMEFAVSAGQNAGDDANQETMALVPGDGDGAYGAQLAYFAGCIKNHSEPERCRPEEAADAVRLALLLKQSRDEGGRRLACDF